MIGTQDWTQEWLRHGQTVGGLVRDTLRRNQPRPECPRCQSSRAVVIARIEIEELPGHPLVEQRDWQCRTCQSTIRETIPGV